jgi:hypothetical protein
VGVALKLIENSPSQVDRVNINDYKIEKIFESFGKDISDSSSSQIIDNKLFVSSVLSNGILVCF